MATGTLAIIGLASTAIGAGVSAYGQYQQGKAQEAIANYNAQQRERQSDLDLLAARVAQATAKRQTDANFALASAEANARLKNAGLIEKNALDGDAATRENIRRRRSDFARLQGEQRAEIASSGIVESSGTPLGLIAETAGAIQRDAEETAYANELSRRSLFREADLERLGGQLALAGATVEKDSALSEIALRTSASQIRAGQERREAGILRLTGQQYAKAGAIGAGATLFSGLTQTAGRYSELNYQGALRSVS